MVSRRTLFAISMMMAVLFFLFIFSGAAKEHLNDYGINQYAKESELRKSTYWQPDKNAPDDIVLIGSNNSRLANVAKQFCSYSKKKIKIYSKISDYKLPKDNKPILVLLDSMGIDYEKDTALIYDWAGQGVNIVFCNLPKSSIIEGNEQLAGLLGINKVYSDKVQIEGVELFGGFLLGGDTIYKVEAGADEEEKKLQDFELNIPWYETTTGTKTYIVGLMDKDKVENEYMPAILWRNSVGSSKVFAVNGDFMSKQAGIGLLSGIITESSDYYIYPVVNAQNLSIANFPGLANENNDEMMEIYSRSQSAIYRELLWPNILSAVQKNHNKMTCLMSLQYDYKDANEPSESALVYYLKSIREADAEAGLSSSRKGSINVADKFSRDRLFIVNQSNKYEFSSYYSAKDDIEDVVSVAGTMDAENMRTITTDFDETLPVLSYAADDITLQMATIDGYSHTYQEDLRVKSLETALGYSNILVDIKRVSWPETEDDRWEKLSEKFSKYTNTYWKAFNCFEQTTLSESDRRVRNLLALDYKSEKNDNIITLDVENSNGKSWFILRLHGEEIESIEGGTFEEIEDNVFLIEVDEDQSHVEMKLNNKYNDSYFYLNNTNANDK